MVWFWFVGLAFSVLGGVAAILGLGTHVPLGPWIDGQDTGLISIELPSPAEARQQQKALIRKLRFSQIGLLLATFGGVVSAFGTQPWSL